MFKKFLCGITLLGILACNEDTNMVSAIAATKDATEVKIPEDSLSSAIENLSSSAEELLSSAAEESSTSADKISSSSDDEDTSATVAKRSSSSSAKQSSSSAAKLSSSSSAARQSSSSAASDTSTTSTTSYDCSIYNCITTEYLNQEMLAAGKYGEYLDTRDNQVYKTIQIGEQVWMAQNLNYAKSGSECFESNETNCTRYGRLYLQSDAKTVCPSGWHLPSNDEWTTLNDYVKTITGNTSVGNSLKSLTWTTGERGTDDFGFSGLASHFFGSVLFCGSSTHGLYWTADDNEYRCLLNDNSVLYYYKDTDSDTWGMSVRCLKGDAPYIETTESSSSSAAKLSSSSVASTSSYDCDVYDCITTEYLNQEMLAAGKYGEYLDNRDNQVYKTIQIGEQVWMAQNLNYEYPNSKCDSSDENCEHSGRLYNWAQVMDIDEGYNNSDASSLIEVPHQGICPAGFHVPTNSEFQTLHDFVKTTKSVSSVTTELNSSSGWYTKTSDDEFGFSMIPMNAADLVEGSRASFWTATQLSTIRSNRWFKDYATNPFSGETFSNTISDPKTFFMNLRCLKN